jgi:RimJ/RimL family protein N-acetyltransferase
VIDYGHGVVLKALDSKSQDKIRGWRNDYKIWKWCRQHDVISDKTQERWFEFQDKDPQIRMYGVWTNLDILVGVCGLTDHDMHNRRAEFSLYIAPEHQGQNLGRMALKTLMAHGFLNLNLHLIWGEAFSDNPAMKTFDEVGFKRDGIRRDFYFREGKYVDAHLFSITEKEWKSLP